MMKKITLTILGLLLMVGGVMAQTALDITGGKDWEAWETEGEVGSSWGPSAENHSSGIVRFKSNAPKYSRIGGKNWAATYSGSQQTFIVTLNKTFNRNGQGISNDALASGFCLVATKDGKYSNGVLTDDENNNWNGSGYFITTNGAESDAEHLKIIGTTGEQSDFDANNKLVLTLTVNADYDAVYLYASAGSWKFIKIESITRTVGASVVAPTISPASGTYDGDFRVTITPGDGNTSVKYSISGSTSHNVTNAVITEETVISFTDNQNITVTATGYDGENASSPVTNTYTYGVPSGKTSASITYYALSSLLMGDGTSRAFYDFEDGVTMPGADNSSNPLRVSENFTGGTSNLSIVDCDADHISATGSTKCLKIDFSGKNQEQTNNYDSQIALYFNGTLTEGHTYYVHFWTKAETHVNDKANTLVEFQKNGKDWNRSHQNTDVDYDTSWHEYMYAIQPSRGDASMMCFNLGKVHNNVLYIDDIAVFDATDDTTPVSFSDLKSTAVISSSDFSNYAAGDYIQLNITGSPSNIGYKSHASNDEYKVPYLAEYTNLEQTNGNWLIPVTSDIKSNGLSIKGYNMTLNSVDIYKKVAISEATNNTISSKEDNVVIELTRSFVKDTWNTVCLPFALTTDQATQLFGSGYQLAEFTSVSGTTMKFTTAASFEAGVPYLVKPTIDVSNASPIVLVDVDITAKTPQTITYGDYSYVGTFSTKTFSGDECNTSLFVAANNELMKPNNNSALKSLRCYFTVPSVAAARTFSLGFDEEGGTTSINTVNGSGIMVNGYYNLNGQHVTKPTKGLFIVNGKKVVIK